MTSRDDGSPGIPVTPDYPATSPAYQPQSPQYTMPVSPPDYTIFYTMPLNNMAQYLQYMLHHLLNMIMFQIQIVQVFPMILHLQLLLSIQNPILMKIQKTLILDNLVAHYLILDFIKIIIQY